MNIREIRKKALSCLLAGVMVFGMAVPAFAANTNSSAKTVTLDGFTEDQGTVSVSITTDTAVKVVLTGSGASATPTTDAATRVTLTNAADKAVLTTTSAGVYAKLKVTATAKTGYTLDSIAVGENSYTTGSEVNLEEDTAVVVKFKSTVVPDTEITTVTMSGTIAEPVWDNSPATAKPTTADPGYTVDSMQWKANNTAFSGEKFGFDTAYTAEIVLKAKEGYTFAANPTLSFGTGYTISANGNTATVAKTFSKTEKQAVAPTLTFQNTTLNYTTNATVNLKLEISATGTPEGAVTYAWSHDGSPLTTGVAADGLSYTIPAALLSTDANKFTVTATAVGTTASNKVTNTADITLKVVEDNGKEFSTTPTFTQNNETKDVFVDDVMTLSAEVSNAAQLDAVTYQWKKDGTVIPNATAVNYSISKAALADSGKYTLTVTNTEEGKNPASATYTVDVTVQAKPIVAAPVITLTPAETTITTGESVTVTANIEANADYDTTKTTYAWKVDGKSVVGNANTCTFTAPATATESYKVEVTVTVTGKNGTTNSAKKDTTFKVVAVPGVNDPVVPTFKTNLAAAKSIYAGSNLELKVEASVTDGGVLSYKWFKNDKQVSSGSDSFTISFVSKTDAGSYKVVVTNTLNGKTTSATSTVCVVTVNEKTPEVKDPVVPTIKTNLALAKSVNVGDKLELMVEASVTDNGVLSYKWLKDSKELGTTSTATFTVASATKADAGSYQVIVINTLNNKTATADSAICAVTVNEKTEAKPVTPTIKTDIPTAKTLTVGDKLELKVEASVTDNGTMNYWWYKGDVKVGTNSPTFTINSVAKADAGSYKVVVTNTLNGKVADAKSKVCVVTVNSKSSGGSTGGSGSGSTTTPTEPAAPPTIDTSDAVNNIKTSTAPKVEITVSKPDVVKNDLFTAAQDAKKDISLTVVDANGDMLYTWDFAAKDITLPQISVSMELKVTDAASAPEALKSIIGAAKGEVLSFSHSGYLPGKATVTVNVKNTFADGSKLNYYYLNPITKIAETVATGLNVANGKVALPMTHCSEYLLTTETIANAVPAPAVEAPAAVANPKTGDSNPVLYWMAGLLLVAGGLFVTALLKSKSETKVK